MRRRYGLNDGRYEPGKAGPGRVMLIVGMLLVIFTIIYFTKDAPPSPNPHPRKTARGQ